MGNIQSENRERYPEGYASFDPKIIYAYSYALNQYETIGRSRDSA